MTDSHQKKLTIFAAPKAFSGHIGMIQKNAITSWSLLSDDIEVILLGDDDGVAEIAEELSLRHFPMIDRNELGTPLLNSIFNTAHHHSNSKLMMYVNSDILLTGGLSDFIDSVLRLEINDFLAIGMRRDFDQHTPLTFENDWESSVQTRAFEEGEYASMLCKDYFIFPKHCYQNIPAFSIGRGNWDSWMVATAAKQKMPIIDATRQVFAGHQNHDHGHAGGRMKAYVSGDEAKTNIRLAGGTRYIKGSVPTHRLNENGQLERINRLRILPLIWDSPRLLKQLISFFIPGKHRSIEN